MPACKHCGHPVPRGRGRLALYCSAGCRLEAQKDRRRERNRERDRMAGKEEDLFGHGRYRRCCDWFACGKTFWAKRWDAVYCSGACRQAAWRYFRGRGEALGM